MDAEPRGQEIDRKGTARVQEPDPQVIRAAARGDIGAFEQLVHAHQSEVWRFLCHLVHDRALAEDLTQETFLRVYRRLGSFRFRSRFSTWLLQIARNAGIDALRARDRSRTLEQSLPRVPPVADPSAKLEVTEAVGSLELRLREVFVLVEVFGLSYREAGAALGIPEGTVKSRMFHARRQLVAWLAAAEGGAADAL